MNSLGPTVSTLIYRIEERKSQGNPAEQEQLGKTLLHLEYIRDTHGNPPAAEVREHLDAVKRMLRNGTAISAVGVGVATIFGVLNELYDFGIKDNVGLMAAGALTLLGGIQYYAAKSVKLSLQAIDEALQYK